MMKTTRLLFLSVVVCWYVMLTGFDSTAADTTIKPAPTENITTPDVTDLEKPPNLAIPLKVIVVTEPVATTAKQTPPAEKSPLQPDTISTDKPLELKPTPANVNQDIQKSLNLSIPFKTDNDVDLPTDQNNGSQNQPSNMFAPNATKKPQSIRLDGNVLMTQEPEAEKRKTLDGAGISINLKP